MEIRMDPDPDLLHYSLNKAGTTLANSYLMCKNTEKIQHINGTTYLSVYMNIFFGGGGG